MIEPVPYTGIFFHFLGEREVREIKIKGTVPVPVKKSVFRIRIQLNPDPAKILNPDPDPDPEDLESGSGSKLFLNTIFKKIKLLHNYKIFS